MNIISLNKLLKPFDFPTDPKDNIKNVKITLIRLKPHNNECDIIIKLPEESNKTIYELAKRWINFQESEILNVFNIREVELSFEFQENDEILKIQLCSRRDYEIDKSLDPLVLKYLKYWQLVK